MHARVAGPTEMDLKGRIVDFVGPASIEVTAHEMGLLDALTGELLPGSAIYVTHTPKDSLADVVRVACEIERAGFRAWPHLVARRIHSERELQHALEHMRDAGISRALLIAGDLSNPPGPFESSLDLLATGALARTGFLSLGVAGHPEGHRRIGASVLWSALREKQEYGESTGSRLHIVSQFSFDPGTIADWGLRLAEHGIRLPVHAGIAGPASLRTLIKFAMLCGIGASLNALMTNLSALSSVRHLATAAEEMLLGLVRARDGESASRIVQPHFYCFGGAAKTTKWLRAIQRGAFDIDEAANTLVVRP
jgi:methylenetetrahydrofolate reductase (NADPH)